MNKRTIGTEMELRASDFLEKQGFQILERNFQCRTGKIDIVAWERNTLCFLEVKYRQNQHYGSPFAAITPHKQKTIRQVAAHYMLTHHISQNTPCRFDAVGILGNEIELIRDAF